MVVYIIVTFWSFYGEILAIKFPKFCHRPLNHRFHLVISFCSWYLHFLAFTVKFSLNPITAQKITNFQNTVRRLKIILLSLFFLLIIRASIWSPYGKNLADPRYDQKDDHIAKYCHKPRHLRIHLVFLYLLPNRCFGTLTLKYLLNPITIFVFT